MQRWQHRCLKFHVGQLEENAYVRRYHKPSQLRICLRPREAQDPRDESTQKIMREGRACTYEDFKTFAYGPKKKSPSAEQQIQVEKMWKESRPATSEEVMKAITEKANESSSATTVRPTATKNGDPLHQPSSADHARSERQRRKQGKEFSRK